MVRISKQNQRRNQSPRKHRNASMKTGPKKDTVPYKEKANALEGELAMTTYIAKIK